MALLQMLATCRLAWVEGGSLHRCAARSAALARCLGAALLVNTAGLIGQELISSTGRGALHLDQGFQLAAHFGQFPLLHGVDVALGFQRALIECFQLVGCDAGFEDGPGGWAPWANGRGAYHCKPDMSI